MLALRKRKITPDVDRLARKEVLSEVRGGKTDRTILGTNGLSHVRTRSGSDISTTRPSCSALGRQRDHALARQIRQFVKDMPAVETRRHVLKKELSELADSRRRGAEQGVNADRRGDTRGDERTR